jgi:hypothetical protein
LKVHGLSKEDLPAATDTKAVVAAYTKNTPVPEILAQHNISYGQLYTILARENVPVRKVSEAQGRIGALNTAVAMYQKGSPLWKIKAETGVAQPTLHAELHTRKITLRRPRK